MCHLSAGNLLSHFVHSHLINIPFMVVVSDIRAQAMHIPRSRCLYITIAQESKPVLVPVHIVVVFPPRRLDRLEEMYRLESCESAMHSSMRGR